MAPVPDRFVGARKVDVPSPAQEVQLGSPESLAQGAVCLRAPDGTFVRAIVEVHQGCGIPHGHAVIACEGQVEVPFGVRDPWVGSVFAGDIEAGAVVKYHFAVVVIMMIIYCGDGIKDIGRVSELARQAHTSYGTDDDEK